VVAAEDAEAASSHCSAQLLPHTTFDYFSMLLQFHEQLQQLQRGLHAQQLQGNVRS
jgi:hypothetical protein